MFELLQEKLSKLPPAEAEKWVTSLSPAQLDFLVRVRDDDLKEAAETSFYSFFQQAWSYIWPNIKFVNSWFYKDLCDELQQLADCNLKGLSRPFHLNVNIPPGSGKTSIISIALPAWIWIKDPTKRLMTTSYSPKLAEDNNDASSRLMQSEWYQNNWGSLFTLTKTLATETKNNKGGYRITTSPGSLIGTGYHGDFIVNDDPQSAEQVYSKVYRATVQRWLDETIASRLVDKMKSVMINIQQRLHGDDLTAHLRSTQASLYKFIVLPAEMSSLIEPAEWREKYQDGLLCKDRFNRKALDTMKSQMRNAYSGQVRQDPRAEGGNLFRDEYPHWFTQEGTPRMDRIIVSADTSNTSTADSCPTSIQVWAKAAGVPAYYLLFDETELMTPGKALTRIDAISNMYPGCQIVVENAASGFGIIEALKKTRSGVFAFNPQKYGGKLKRAEMILYLWEAGNVFLYDTEHTRAKYLPEITAFPTGEYMDRVDSMSMALIWMTRGQHGGSGGFYDPGPVVF